MKGFPNQIADLAKLAKGMQTLAELVDAGRNARDDGVFGQSLVRSGVAGTGHSPRPVNEYIREQLAKAPSDQSFRTTARGLRELFRALGLIDDSANPINVTPIGRHAAGFADQPMDLAQITFWRRVIRNMRHDGGDGESSHPYQVLLRLIARRPGLAKPMCALALEAKNDSPEELDRITALSELPENKARLATGVTQRNWDNAVKVLPRLAEQLRDVEIVGSLRYRSYRIADAPGTGRETAEVLAPAALVPTPPLPAAPRAPITTRAPRSSRAVTANTIGRAGTAEDFDDVVIPTEVDPDAMANAVRIRRERLRRHNLLVRELAARFAESGGTLFEDPFDILAVLEEYGILVEVKTLDGSVDDERERVRDSLGQLLYYEAFVTRPVAGDATVRKIACFEGPITEVHQRFLNASRIGTIWKDGEKFAGDPLAAEFIGDLLRELRP